MSEILCPMCGQSNPGELETCQHCQARLKPLTADSHEKSLLASRELPDWLKDDDSDHPSDVPLDGAAEIKEWLTRIRSDNDLNGEIESSSPEKENDSDGVDDNWIEKARSLKSADDSPPETAIPSNLIRESSEMENDGGIPKWLSDLGNNAELSPTSIAEPESQLPDWFESADEVSTPQADPEEETDILDRLAASDEPSQPEAVPAKELPNLFENADEVPTTQADPEEETASKLDWLDDSDQEPAITSTAEKEDIPDWLAAADEPSQPKAVPAKEIPDLFARTDEAPTTQADLEEETASKLDWLDDSDQEPAIASPAEKDDIPDWLAAAAVPSQPEVVPTDDFPDWLTRTDDLLEPKTKSQPEEQAAVSTSEQITPDHLKEIEDISLSEQDSSPTSLHTETSISDTVLEEDIFGTDQLPTWLIDYDEEDEPSYTVESDTNGLTPAALPDWIEAIRPKDMAGMESSGFQQHVPAETSGPLAGISDALKAEPEIVSLQKLPAYPVKLEVSEKQIQSAAILENLIEQENAAPFVPTKPTALPPRAFRWIIAALFFVVISFAIISSEQPTIPRYQGMVPEQVFRASEQINALSPKDTVLIAFDYEPGTSGELNTAAVPVLDHIMLKGARLALISTTPTGPALADHMVNTLLKEHHYLSGIQYINLGYIPGGASGLLGFTQIPQQITPLSFDGMNSWQTRPLEGIYTLSDFSLVVVITDNPDIARTWFEQIQPTLAGTALIAIISAQAEAILQPYYGNGDESAQIQGLVSGILGGAAYEQITGRANLASQYWKALNFGILTAIIIILLSSAINNTTIMMKRNRGKKATRKAT